MERVVLYPTSQNLVVVKNAVVRADVLAAFAALEREQVARAQR